ncbi:hypothetical protein HDU85_006523 [Gaertneriomyces sp. JEL0708]|nr:hypothetical protein HDU85_006523 [Gaertneriomyces sp. JEL0708]
MQAVEVVLTIGRFDLVKDVRLEEALRGLSTILKSLPPSESPQELRITGPHQGTRARLTVDCLPEEVWVEIARCKYRMRDLLSLCHVSRSFYKVFSRRLYTGILIDPRRISAVQRNLYQLLVTLRSRPELASHVRELRVNSLDSAGLVSDKLVFHLISMNVAEMPGLQRLSLTYYSDSPKNAMPTSFPSIKHLDLSRACGRCPKMFEALPDSLEELFLRDSLVEEHDFFQLVRRCPNLKIVGLNGCEYLTDASIIELINCCPKLEALALGYRHRFLSFDTILLSIAEQLTQLKALYLDGSDSVSEHSLRFLVAKHGPNLRTLSLSFCKISDEFLKYLADTCVKLEVLAVNGCGNAVTDESILYIMRNCKSLRLLSALENASVSEKVADQVEDRFGDHVPGIVDNFRYWGRWLEQEEPDAEGDYFDE